MIRATLVLTGLLSSSLAAAADAPEFTIGSVATSGAGCPADATQVALLPDGRIDFTLPRSVVQVGEGIPLEDAARRCEVAVTLEHEAGWSFAVRKYEVFGQAELSEGLTGSVSLWHNNDERRPLKVSETLTGPLTNHDYHLDASQDRDRVVWSDCYGGQSIKLALALELTPGEGHEGTMGQCGCGKPDVRVELLWRRCRKIGN